MATKMTVGQQPKVNPVTAWRERRVLCEMRELGCNRFEAEELVDTEVLLLLATGKRPWLAFSPTNTTAR